MAERTQLSTVKGRCRSGVLAVVGMSFAINLLILTTSIYMLQVYDRVLPGHSLSTLHYLTIITVAALLAMGLFELLRSRTLVRVSSWIDRVLSPLVFARGLENAVRGAAYRTEGVRDLSTVCKFLAGGGILALCDAPWMPIFLGFIFLLHPLLGLVACIGAVVLFALAVANNIVTRDPLKRANAAANRGFRAAESAVRNAEVIDGMGMIGALRSRWDRGNAEVLELQERASDRASWISAGARTFRMILQVAILGVGAWLVLANELTPGAMIAASIIMGRALSPVEQAIGTWKNVIGAREAWQKLSALLQEPPLHGSGMALPAPKGEISVENVSYTPPGAKHPVIRNVTFRIGAGETLAMIGPSAAGKSTLARLLVGIHAPEKGAVRLDGADVHSWNRERFGYYVGYLPQDVELFPGTVRENIARMSEEPNAEAVVTAATLAGVHEMILRLPKGYDTEIGEQGAILSGGQRQRIGLARALYGRPAVLVLDEPNSSLDTAGEQALQDAIQAMKELGTTVIVIAHRPSLMVHIDKVVLLRDGRVEIFGERNIVLAQIQRGNVQPAEGRQLRTVKVKL
jgi:ATP-binding cassette subfamily C protein/ATP-binding cassette subfamily C protein EexD